MTHPRTFRFGVQLSQADSGDAWAAAARQAEDLGYSTLFVPDHLDDQLAPVPAMMAAADATTDLKVGTLLFDNDYKHPVVLAKEAATIDVLSGGRTEFGLGAGWMRSDYEQSGIPYDEPAVRVDRMEEGLAIIKGLFGDGPVDFAGEHYTITGLEGTPKPIQRPGPPILIGGGRPRVLGIAAREADIVGINPTIKSGVVDADAAKDASPEATDRKLGWIKEAAGERFDELELNMLIFVAAVTDDRRAFAELLAGGFGVTPEEALDIPHALFGSVEEIGEGLERTRERWGVSYFVVQGLDAMTQLAPVVARMTGR